MTGRFRHHLIVTKRSERSVDMKLRAGKGVGMRERLTSLLLARPSMSWQYRRRRLQDRFGVRFVALASRFGTSLGLSVFDPP
jgi:hypothetical protein